MRFVGERFYEGFRIGGRGTTLPIEPALPEGKIVRTASGGTDALKKVLVDLKRYSFSGYVRTVLGRGREATEGCIVVIDGNPELALHLSGDRQTEGKVALREIWQDSYAERCSIEIHAKVDVEAIRAAYPGATLERVARPQAVRAPAREAEEKVAAWREAGYEVDGLVTTLQRGGPEAKAAFEAFEADVAKMDPLRKELDGFEEPSVMNRVADLREQTRDPANHESVARALGELRQEVERRRRLDLAVTGDEAHLQERARQVFEMIVRRRAAEGRPTTISESQVVKAMEGKPTTRDEKTNLIRQYTFNTFVTGPSNRFAHAASLAVAKSPHTAYNPLFITSGPGLGKTHLLCAIGNAILEENRKARVSYVTTEGFSNEFKEATIANRLNEFRAKYRTLDVALIDDAQFLSGKGDVQEELFHTFNDLYNANRQIVLTSDRLPKEIPDLEDRLISRFESGLIADIQKPEYETRLAILRRKAQDAGVAVEDEVLAYIARLVEDNIRELGGALNRVLAFSSLMDQSVSLDLAREVLRDLGGKEESRAAAKVSRAEKDIRPGHSYVIEEDRPERAFRLFGTTVGDDGRALLITRSNPRRVKEKHEVRNARTLWLTERESGAIETIPPSLERIIYVIEEFMNEGGRGAIMIDGIEYLVSSNSFDAVLKFLRRLVDHTSESQFVLFVAVSTKTMKEQETKNLEREMEVLTF